MVQHCYADCFIYIIMSLNILLFLCPRLLPPLWFSKLTAALLGISIRTSREHPDSLETTVAFILE